MERSYQRKSPYCNFADTIGVAKRENVIDYSLLEFCVREDLNKKALRTMAVLDPVLLVIDNYPEDQTEMMDAVNNPENAEMGIRKVLDTQTVS